jgi:TonB family protein
MGTGVDAGHQTIGAVVIPAPRPVGTTGTSTPPAKRVRPSDAIRREPAPVTEQARSGEGQAIGAAHAGSDQEQSIGAPTGPVRLSAGQHLGLIKKVEPVYPTTLSAAGIEGTVVLDAVIHRDGSVGDVTVVRSTNAAFEQPAIAAVKQWRYTPLPHDGLLTVTINFTLRR